MAVPLKELEKTCREIGHIIGDVANKGYDGKKVGFALLMFDFGEGGNMTYTSNAEREDMIKAMKELIANITLHLDSPANTGRG